MIKVNLIFGTVYGSAQFVAETLLEELKQSNRDVHLFQHDELKGFVPPQDELLLVVCSTTGQGNLPDDIQPWFSSLKDSAPYLPRLRYGVICLGDSGYDTFCAAGMQWDGLLTELGGKRIGELLKIDATETMEPEHMAQTWFRAWIELVDMETLV